MAKIRIFYHDHENFGWKTTYAPQDVSPEEYKLIATKEKYDFENLLQLRDQVFDWFNAGSGNECKEFLEDYTIRSLSVGDIVEIDGTKYLCMSAGWADL